MVSWNPKVSIITVVRNSVGTIAQTIKSVLEQTYQNIEYIVIDGASTDGTREIIEQYTDSIATYVSEEDAGLYYAMNKGIKMATGEIVGIINSDDWYNVEAVQDAVACLAQKNTDVVYGKIVRITEDGRGKDIRNMPLENLWYQMVIPHPSVFIKRDIYKKYGVFDVNYKLAADYELILRLYSKHVKFRYLDKVMAYFREGGLSKQRYMDVFNEGYRISLAYLDKCPCKETMRIKIEETYRRACFNEMLINTKGVLYKLVCRYFGLRVSRMLIFGSGVWGNRCCRYLSDSGVEVACFVDNDSSKWGTRVCDIEVVAPSRLQGMEEYVLIASEEYAHEIREQLNSMDNGGLKCVTLADLRALWEDNNSEWIDL